MKNTITLLIALFISISTFAQQGINYKAQLKDTNGNVLAGTFMNVQFTIHQNNATGTIVYQEDHNYTTDANGLLIHNIGTETSPSIGIFEDIDWSLDLHFLQTTITYSGGTINFDATEFMAVPYAKHAETANNVFSGDYNDLINQPTTIPTGLEAIDEGNGIGWRLVSKDPDNYGPIGDGAVDLSYSEFGSTVNGATGLYSTAIGYLTKATDLSATAMGERTTASGNYSTSMGFSNTASADASTAMGFGTNASGILSLATGQNTIASGYNSTAMGAATAASGDYSTANGKSIISPSYAETVVGTFNTDYTLDTTNGPGDVNWNPLDRLFVIGNGESAGTKSNALTVLKNGTITAPSLTNSLINTAGDKALVTKEYLEANGASGLEAIDEGNGISWRLVGSNPDNFGPIGYNAIDLSTSIETSTSIGATGDFSYALGLGARAIGNFSTSTGYKTRASGVASTAMGNLTNAPSSVETVIGQYNTDYTPSNTNGSGDIYWNPTDRLFVIGNGESVATKSNALTVLKNGNVGIGRENPESLLEVAHQNTPPTFEDRTNAFSIRNVSTGESSQLYTDANGSLTLYRNGLYRGYFHNTTGVYNSVSDRRLKKNITALDNGTLDKVMQLNPVSYLMKDQTDTNINLGLISQEVQKLFPSITHYSKEQDILTLSYIELIPILVKALQEQQTIIEKQKAKIYSFESSVTELIKRMNALETINNQ